MLSVSLILLHLLAITIIVDRFLCELNSANNVIIFILLLISKISEKKIEENFPKMEKQKTKTIKKKQQKTEGKEND